MKSIAIDWDGVLTDGKHYLGLDGKLFYATHSRDNWAIAYLINQGFTVDIVTANDSAIVRNYARDRKAGFIYSREKDLTYDIVVVDSMQDINLIVNAKNVFCPKDSGLYLRTTGLIRVPVPSGGGVIDWIVQEGLSLIK